MIQEKEKNYLLNLARNSISSFLEKEKKLNVDEEIQELFPNEGDFLLYKRLGCFVTLKTKLEKQLRGCIGIIESEERLYRNVIDYAIFSSTRDPRFPRVLESELKELWIEISIMGEVKALGQIEDIIIGNHGLIVERGPYRGLLLPQVASEYGWDREVFLEQTCLKAGLDSKSYLDRETQLFFFDSICFSEEN